MNAQEFAGEWYLPNSDLKLSGQLLIDHDKRKIELVLYSTLYIGGLKISLGARNNDSKYAHDIILGKTNFESITIVNCRWRQTHWISKRRIY